MDEDLPHLVGVVCDIRSLESTRWFFPSKVGGNPSWLIPDRIPEINCDSCGRPMTFLLQIYAPVPESESAFHRSLMVFSCLQCRCFLRAFRVQLPLVNSYYGTESLTVTNAPIDDPVIAALCCEQCGMPKHGGGLCRSLPEYGLEIESLDEINMEEDDEDMDSDGDDVEEEKLKMMQITGKSDMTLDEDETDVFNDFTETAIEHDASFRVFKRFTAEAPTDHVVYYSLGANPLWITDQNQIASPPPNCEHCGGTRQFEFQIQPQLIFHLMKRLRGFPMNAAPFEWGVVAVYTCVNNCTSPQSHYCEEFLFNQLEPAEWLDFHARKKVDFSKDKSSPPKLAGTESESDGEWT